MKISRPHRLALAVFALGVATPALAQTSITDKQREDLAKLTKATGQERRFLLEAQEGRVALPPNIDQRMKEFLESSWSYQALMADKTPELGILLLWNEVTLLANALDHTNIAPPGSKTAPYFGEQFGPPRSSRVMAIVHVAMSEAVGVLSPKYQSYAGIYDAVVNNLTVAERLLLESLPGDVEQARAAKNRAIVEAAYQTLANLYPKKQPLLKIAYDLTLVKFPDPGSPAVLLGLSVGSKAAKAILDLRYFDGSELPDLSSDDFASGNPYKWHQDPISKSTTALGGNWPRVKPFLIPSADAFRDEFLPGPPAPDDPRFIAAYKWSKWLGGDPNTDESIAGRWKTDTYRSGASDPNRPAPLPPGDTNQDQTFVGIFWAYDGSNYLCAPPRLYNMIATSVALREKPIEHVEDFAHYLAFLNLAMADAGLGAWDGKYHFLYPRPVTLLREVRGDDTVEGAVDPHWTPLGAQMTNADAKSANVSPPFPAYPSGHATFGGALFRAMALYFKSTDPAFPEQGIPFDFVSDEYNGKNYAPGAEMAGKPPRDRLVCHFTSFKQAERLNAESRIYLGVHWEFDAVDGVNLGNAIASDAFAKFVKKRPR